MPYRMFAALCTHESVQSYDTYLPVRIIPVMSHNQIFSHYDLFSASFYQMWRRYIISGEKIATSYKLQQI